MDKKQELELKLEIYQNIYDAIVLNNTDFLAEEMVKLKSQLELLKEMEKK